MDLYLNGRLVQSKDIIPTGIYLIKPISEYIVKAITVNGVKKSVKTLTATLEGEVSIKVLVKTSLVTTKTYSYTLTAKKPFRVFTHHNNYTAEIKVPREFLKFERNVIVTNQWWDFWPESRNCATEMDMQPIAEYDFISQIQKDIIDREGIKTLRDLSKYEKWRALAESIRLKVPTNESVMKKGLEWAYFNDEIVDVDLEYYWSQFKGIEAPNNYWYGGVGKITDQKLTQIRELARLSIDRIKWVKSNATVEQAKRLKYISYLPTIVWDFINLTATENWKTLIFENYIKPISEHLDFLGPELYRNKSAEGTHEQFLKKCQFSLDIYKTLNLPIIPFMRPNFDLDEQKSLFNLIYSNCAGVIWWEDRHINWTEKDQHFAQYIQNYQYRIFE